MTTQTQSIDPYDVKAKQRLLKKVLKQPSGCWEWQGTKSGNGYGRLFYRGRYHTAHRVSYQLYIGPIPEGLVIDHLCRNRGCVNPEHLEPVTFGENIRRSPIHNMRSKTHCPEGHEYTKKNTFIRRSGSRECRTCKKVKDRIRARAYRARSGAKSQPHRWFDEDEFKENTL